MSTVSAGPGIHESALASLRPQFRGDLIQPGDAAYEAARQVHNAATDRHPALIAQATDTADVMAAVRFGREQGLTIAVRGGGHHGAGFGTVDDGLVIDLGAMRGVRVDPAAKTARVEGGARLSDVDHATHAFGLALAAGVISTTGVAGLTLGAGVGHLTRHFGLTIDNLLEADIVLASGELVRASAEENADLFWALRGGGGNFGVVTSFLFRLHPVSTVMFGPTLYELDKAPEVLRWYREFMAQAPDDLSGFFAFLVVPPVPPFPEALHLRKMCGIVWCYSGPQEKAEAVLAPVRSFGPPALDGIGPAPFPAVQTAFDGLYPAGQYMSWRSDMLDDIPDAAIEQHLRFAPDLPSVPSTVHFYPIDGAAHRVGTPDTAFSYRDARWAMTIVGVGRERSDLPALRAWTKTYWEAVHPYGMGGGYVNFFGDEGQDRVRQTYRDNYDRLTRIKAHYDPDNLFHLNQNIRPA
ncbi:MAG TPA: FAD-binding oxidoreductase [Candidatus Limnocylindrales bacterium]|nr:FAD-binding oxidoreductase [Candidatus Limnocylindrales bacterium]